MDGNKIKNENYHCCFCNILIESSQGDPCAIDILTHDNKSKNKSSHQIFYCHMECFRSQLHEGVRLHFALECLIPSDFD